MSKNFLVPLLLAWLIGHQGVVASDIFEEYAIKAALSINLARFTEWPKDVDSGGSQGITLCTLGSNIVHNAFAEAENKIVAGKPLTIINLVAPHDLAQCRLLFLSGLEKNREIQLLAEIAKQAILTVGEDPEFLANGGMVLLNVDEGKVKLEINLDAVKKTGLQINSRVLKLATIFMP